MCLFNSTLTIHLTVHEEVGRRYFSLFFYFPLPSLDFPSVEQVQRGRRDGRQIIRIEGQIYVEGGTDICRSEVEKST